MRDEQRGDREAGVEDAPGQGCEDQEDKRQHADPVEKNPMIMSLPKYNFHDRNNLF